MQHIQIIEIKIHEVLEIHTTSLAIDRYIDAILPSESVIINYVNCYY